MRNILFMVCLCISTLASAQKSIKISDIGGIIGATPTRDNYGTLGYSNQSSNRVLASPSSGVGPMSVRLLVSGDIPVLDAAKITTGLLKSPTQYVSVKKAITTNTTLDSTATNWIFDCTSGNITVTLPNASIAPYWLTTGTNQGLAIQYLITRSDNSSNTLIIQTTSSQSIDGASTFSLFDSNSFLNIFSDGANWHSK